MLEQDEREPVLIPEKSQFLLVCSVHERQLRTGVRSTVVALHKRFSLPSVQSEISKVLKRCADIR